jgi:hypothetical protein
VADDVAKNFGRKARLAGWLRLGNREPEKARPICYRDALRHLQFSENVLSSSCNRLHYPIDSDLESPFP